MVLVRYKNSTPFQSTIFITIGNSQKVTGNQTSQYENVQSSDSFSETVQGWFKKIPEFSKRIQSVPGTGIEFVETEKQNIMISFSTNTPDEAKNISTTIKNELQKEIESYNLKTNSDFQIAIFSLNTDEKPLSIALFLIIS